MSESLILSSSACAPRSAAPVRKFKTDRNLKGLTADDPLSLKDSLPLLGRTSAALPSGALSRLAYADKRHTAIPDRPIAGHSSEQVSTLAQKMYSQHLHSLYIR